jgi:hypothetical protein
MRWVVLAALLACKKPDPAPVPPAPDAAGMTRTVFTKAAPVVGAKRQESSDLDMAISMTVDGKRNDTTVKEWVRHSDEVLAVNGDAITKVRTTFDSVAGTQPSAITGKTYVVESKDGKIDVRDAQDKPAPANEAKEVEKNLKNLGKPDAMSAALPAIGVVPGQKVDAVAKALSDQLRDTGESTTAKDVVVTFKEQRGDEGVFDVALKLVKDEGAMSMVIDVKGETFVSTKTGATTRMNLTGPITVSGGNLVKADGSGKMSMKMESKAL